MHVAECMVYDGHITAADIAGMLRDRMHLLPRYRQKIVPAPFGMPAKNVPSAATASGP